MAEINSSQEQLADAKLDLQKWMKTMPSSYKPSIDFRFGYGFDNPINEMSHAAAENILCNDTVQLESTYSERHHVLLMLNNSMRILVLLRDMIEITNDLSQLKTFKEKLSACFFGLRHIVTDQYPGALINYFARCNRQFNLEIVFFKQHELYLYIADIVEMCDLLLTKLNRDTGNECKGLAPRMHRIYKTMYTM